MPTRAPFVSWLAPRVLAWESTTASGVSPPCCLGRNRGDLLYAGSNPFNFLQVTNYAVHVMNDSPEEEEDDETDGILIAEGDDWPEDYYDGFDAPMKVISEILLDSEAWDLPISWPEVLSGWRDARNCWTASNQLRVPAVPTTYLTLLTVARWIVKAGEATRPEGAGAGSPCSSDRRSSIKRSRRW